MVRLRDTSCVTHGSWRHSASMSSFHHCLFFGFFFLLLPAVPGEAACSACSETQAEALPPPMPGVDKKPCGGSTSHAAAGGGGGGPWEVDEPLVRSMRSVIGTSTTPRSSPTIPQVVIVVREKSLCWWQLPVLELKWLRINMYDPSHLNSKPFMIQDCMNDQWHPLRTTYPSTEGATGSQQGRCPACSESFSGVVVRRMQFIWQHDTCVQRLLAVHRAESNNCAWCRGRAAADSRNGGRRDG